MVPHKYLVTGPNSFKIDIGPLQQAQKRNLLLNFKINGRYIMVRYWIKFLQNRYLIITISIEQKSDNSSYTAQNHDFKILKRGYFDSLSENYTPGSETEVRHVCSRGRSLVVNYKQEFYLDPATKYYRIGNESGMSDTGRTSGTPSLYASSLALISFRSQSFNFSNYAHTLADPRAIGE